MTSGHVQLRGADGSTPFSTGIGHVSGSRRRHPIHRGLLEMRRLIPILTVLVATLATVLVTGTPVNAQQPAVTVQFEEWAYTVAESDDPSTPNVAENVVEVEVRLSADPQRQVVSPIEAENLYGASSADYSPLSTSVTFNSGDTVKTITFTATHDTVDDDLELVLLTFGSLPPGVSEGLRYETSVTIKDDDRPTSLTAWFSTDLIPKSCRPGSKWTNPT